MISKIQRIYSFRNRIIISNIDGVKFVNKMNKKYEDVFIYLDPPYYRKGADLYMNFYREQDHQELAKYVKRLDKKWMISYDNQDFILNLYSDNPKLIYKLSQCASNRIGDEVLIFSDSLSFTNSIDRLQSPLIL